MLTRSLIFTGSKLTFSFLVVFGVQLIFGTEALGSYRYFIAAALLAVMIGKIGTDNSFVRIFLSSDNETFGLVNSLAFVQTALVLLVSVALIPFLEVEDQLIPLLVVYAVALNLTLLFGDGYCQVIKLMPFYWALRTSVIGLVIACLVFIFSLRASKETIYLVLVVAEVATLFFLWRRAILPVLPDFKKLFEVASIKSNRNLIIANLAGALASQQAFQALEFFVTGTNVGLQDLGKLAIISVISNFFVAVSIGSLLRGYILPKFVANLNEAKFGNSILLASSLSFFQVYLGSWVVFYILLNLNIDGLGISQQDFSIVNLVFLNSSLYAILPIYFVGMTTLKKNWMLGVLSILNFSGFIGMYFVSLSFGVAGILLVSLLKNLVSVAFFIKFLDLPRTVGRLSLVLCVSVTVIVSLLIFILNQPGYYAIVFVTFGAVSYLVLLRHQIRSAFLFVSSRD